MTPDCVQTQQDSLSILNSTSTGVQRKLSTSDFQGILILHFNLIFVTWYYLINWDFHLKLMRHFHFLLFFGHLLISFIVVELITIIIADSYYEAQLHLTFSCKIEQNWELLS